MIDTRAKGLRGSIPPNFPYFHVEFGLSGKTRDLLNTLSTRDTEAQLY